MRGAARRAPSPPIHGVDFTSRPSRRKPITIATGHLAGDRFLLAKLDELDDFAAFERWLERAGPWVAGFDFPFGLPRMVVEELGWPTAWITLVGYVATMGRETFRATLDAYRARRPIGDKYPYRRGDPAAGSHSPIKLVNPPVALMFLEGAARLEAAGVAIPGIVAGDPERVALEAYPGYAARRLLDGRARISYKNDARAKQTHEHRALRRRMLGCLRSESNVLGLVLEAPTALAQVLVDDGTGDRLDAVLCAMQAAWAWQRRDSGYGLPATVDPLEGWIATVPG